MTIGKKGSSSSPKNV